MSKKFEPKSYLEKKLEVAAKAHTDLNILGAIQSICEGGHFHSSGAQAAADKIMAICEREMRKQADHYFFIEAQFHRMRDERPAAAEPVASGVS